MPRALGKKSDLTRAEGKKRKEKNNSKPNEGGDRSENGMRTSLAMTSLIYVVVEQKLSVKLNMKWK